MRFALVYTLTWLAALALGLVAAWFSCNAVFRASPACEVPVLLGIVAIPIGVVEVQRRMIHADRTRGQPVFPRARSL